MAPPSSACRDGAAQFGLPRQPFLLRALEGQNVYLGDDLLLLAGFVGAHFFGQQAARFFFGAQLRLEAVLLPVDFRDLIVERFQLALQRRAFGLKQRGFHPQQLGGFEVFGAGAQAFRESRFGLEIAFGL